jgi:hypothetical protein
MTLPADRLLNLFYADMVEGLDGESRLAIDTALTGDYSLLAALQEQRLAEQVERDRRSGRRPTAARPAAQPMGPGQRAPRGKDGQHVPGTAPDHIPAPSWWRGDRAAFRSSVAAGQQLGEPAALREPVVPVIGSGALAGTAL